MSTERRNVYFLLLGIILATIPCYCIGLVALATGPTQTSPTSTPTLSLFQTITPVMEPTIMVSPTPSATATPSPSRTPTETLVPTPTQSFPTVVPTVTPLPTSNPVPDPPTETPVPTDTPSPPTATPTEDSEFEPVDGPSG